MNNKYSDCDFSGYATRNDLTCSDGRIIKKDAFKDNDGKKVSLVFDHVHNDVNAVLGHAYLENRDDGVYAYGYFNDTETLLRSWFLMVMLNHYQYGQTNYVRKDRMLSMVI